MNVEKAVADFFRTHVNNWGHGEGPGDASDSFLDPTLLAALQGQASGSPSALLQLSTSSNASETLEQLSNKTLAVWEEVGGNWIPGTR